MWIVGGKDGGRENQSARGTIKRHTSKRSNRVRNEGGDGEVTSIRKEQLDVQTLKNRPSAFALTA